MKLQEALQTIALVIVQNGLTKEVDDDLYYKLLDIARGEKIEMNKVEEKEKNKVEERYNPCLTCSQIGNTFCDCSKR